MFIYEDLADRFVRPIIERHQAVGRAQGIAVGAQAQNELWHAWLQRKQQAEAEGLDFNEPPPGTDQNSNS